MSKRKLILLVIKALVDSRKLYTLPAISADSHYIVIENSIKTGKPYQLKNYTNHI